jgi:hypothetical protein
VNVLRFVIIFIAFSSGQELFAQKTLGTITGDESDLYAQTKQVNQFFRRFNNEEDRFGVRYYPGDSLYRDPAFRPVYLNMLFDQQSPFISESLREEFIETVSDDQNPVFLDFRGDLWFAELAATFNYKHQKENLILFLKLEPENLGYKWVLTNVYYVRFLKQFNKGEKEEIERSFLHPMSHELDFMNMYKAFDDLKYVEYYASSDFKPDYLSILFYELKNGDMEFVSSGELKFHFFQVDGWYFEVSFFNRPGNNSGWLISKLYKVTESEKEELVKFYLP